MRTPMSPATRPILGEVRWADGAVRLDESMAR